MTSSSLARVVPAFLVLSAVSVVAQTDGKTGKPINDSLIADAEWASLKKLKDTGKSVRPVNSDPESVRAAKAQVAASYIEDANKFRDFHIKHPKQPAAKQAKCMEALALILAAQLGNNSEISRRDLLVAEVRRDKTIPARDRAQVAATMDNGQITAAKNRPRAERLYDYEVVARGLTLEFPDIEEGYESLLHLAQDAGPNQAAKISLDLLKMQNAPLWVKKEAQLLLDRQALLGACLPELVRTSMGSNNPLPETQGRVIVLYSWSVADPGSFLLAKELVRCAPPTAVFVGVCVDGRDLEPSKARAAAEKLPGAQVYDWMGQKSDLAQSLKITGSGLAYLADANGTIKSVSAHQDPAAALEALKKQ